MDWGNPLIYVVGGVAATGGLCKLCLWIGGMNSFRATVGGAIEGIHLDIQEMRRDIKEILRQLPSSTISGGSPLRLTDLGRAISEDIGARAWAGKRRPGWPRRCRTGRRTRSRNDASSTSRMTPGSRRRFSGG